MPHIGTGLAQPPVRPFMASSNPPRLTISKNEATGLPDRNLTDEPAWSLPGAPVPGVPPKPQSLRPVPAPTSPSPSERRLETQPIQFRAPAFQAPPTLTEDQLTYEEAERPRSLLAPPSSPDASPPVPWAQSRPTAKTTPIPLINYEAVAPPPDLSTEGTRIQIPNLDSTPGEESFFQRNPLAEYGRRGTRQSYPAPSALPLPTQGYPNSTLQELDPSAVSQYPEPGTMRPEDEELYQSPSEASAAASFRNYFGTKTLRMIAVATALMVVSGLFFWALSAFHSEPPVDPAPPLASSQTPTTQGTASGAPEASPAVAPSPKIPEVIHTETQPPPLRASSPPAVADSPKSPGISLTVPEIKIDPTTIIAPSTMVGSPTKEPEAIPRPPSNQPSPADIKPIPDKEGTVVLPSVTDVLNKGEASSGTEVPLPTVSMSDPRNVLDAFLMAPNWHQRLPFIYEGKKLEPLIQNYYEKEGHPDMPVRANFSYSTTEDSPTFGEPFLVYDVHLAGNAPPIPVVVRNTDAGPRVEWQSFVEFKDAHFHRFMEQKDPAPRMFRVQIERTDYYGADRPQFKNLADYVVYKLTVPGTALDAFGFVDRNSPLAKKMTELADWSQYPLACILELKKTAFPHGTEHFVITRFITDGWYLPPDFKP